MRSLLIVLFGCLLTGCADYLNHNDTVTLAAGDANHYNTMLQTADPFNPQSYDTHIKSSGARGVAVYNGYRGVSYGGSPAANGGSYDGNCPTPESTTADGRRCGDMAASERPGGAP